MEIREYLQSSKRSPFRKWYNHLDTTLKIKVDARLARAKTLGHLGDYKPLKNGVFEFRFKTHSGLRVYFGMDSKDLILLLVGGNKRTQVKDIKKAKEYWQDYKRSD
jgi:putative addiction module killer protein